MAENIETNNYSINIIDIIKLFLKRWFVILLAGLICMGATFAYIYTQTERKYVTNSLLYVNNSSGSSIKDAITNMSDIYASQSIAQVYSIIIKTRTTLNKVKKYLKDEYGLEYTYEQLNGMITVGTEKETEILKITVVGLNEYNIILIANAVANVAKEDIGNIINGADVKIIDEAQVSSAIAKDTAKKSIIAFVIGALVACVIYFIIYIVNDSIESEEGVIKIFGDNIPLLAVIPNANADAKQSKKYYGYKKYYQSKENN